MNNTEMYFGDVGNLTFRPASMEIFGWTTAGVHGGANGAFSNYDINNDSNRLSFGSRAVTDDVADAGGSMLANWFTSNGVKSTVTYQQIWSTADVRGGNPGACWLPLAPEGYTAIGCVFTDGSTPNFPTLTLRNDLVYYSPTVNPVWSTAGVTGGADLSLSCAPLLVAASDGQENLYYMSAGTFMPTAEKIPMITVILPSTPTAQVPPTPQLNSINPPPNTVALRKC